MKLSHLKNIIKEELKILNEDIVNPCSVDSCSKADVSIIDGEWVISNLMEAACKKKSKKKCRCKFADGVKQDCTAEGLHAIPTENGFQLLRIK